MASLVFYTAYLIKIITFANFSVVKLFHIRLFSYICTEILKQKKCGFHRKLTYFALACIFVTKIAKSQNVTT